MSNRSNFDAGKQQVILPEQCTSLHGHLDEFMHSTELVFFVLEKLQSFFKEKQSPLHDFTVCTIELTCTKEHGYKSVFLN